MLATKLEGYFVSSASINPNQRGNWHLDMGSCLNKFENVQIWHGGWLAGSKKNKARHLKAPNAITMFKAFLIFLLLFHFALFSQNSLLFVGSCLEMIGNYF